MERIHISFLHEDEIKTLQHLAESIWRVCYKEMISPAQIDYMLNQRYQPDLLRKQLSQGDLILAARAGKRMVGFAHAYVNNEGLCKLDKLYVSTSYQHRGIGSQLVHEVEAFAHRQNCELVILRVYKGNQPALNAYRKYGFKLITEFREDIGNGFVMDDCVMGKAVMPTAKMARSSLDS